ncbi:hypothetical protein [Glycomyces tenuis]|uniref:hypothetical protein n=1 Tax=Glycomyces tenuis TaxID=58116 RepID=UPI000419C987|nr:hypothetical protein [Glycomyces tenuis]
MTDKGAKSEVIAFRLGAHHLTERLGEGGLPDVSGRSARAVRISASASSRCGGGSASRRAKGTRRRSSWSTSGSAVRSRTAAGIGARRTAPPLPALLRAVDAGDTAPRWDRIEDELTRVDFGGEAWMLAEDRDKRSIRFEAERIAPLRGASSVNVEFDTY